MYSYFGRLNGATLALAALGDTSPPSALTPFATPAPGSKFLAYGEDGNTAAFNRALAALSANTDSLAGTLDAPATKAEVLESGSAGLYGHSALTGVASGAASVNLGAGGQRPVAWMFVGLHKSQLSQHIQMLHTDAGARADRIIHPTDIMVPSGGGLVSYFPASVNIFSSGSANACPTKVPPVSLITTALPPYEGSAITSNVSAFDNDGCYLASTTWAGLLLRAGCFVSIVHATPGQPNTGLYRIARLAGGTNAATAKAVLTRPYTQLTVADGTKFAAGELVTWRSRPDHADGASSAGQRTNRAYVMFRTGNVLHLGGFLGSDDLAVAGSADKVSVNTSGTTLINEVGLHDPSDPTGANTALPTGTVLWNFDGTKSSTVSAVVPAGYPVNFATNGAGYQLQPCSPPGFVLNPTLVLPSHSVGGSFDVHFRALSTVRENLLSSGLSATVAAARPQDGGWARQTVMERWFRELHHGSDDPGTGGTGVAREYGMTRQILGDGYWSVTVVNTTDGQLASAVLPAGYLIPQIAHPTLASTYTRAQIVTVSGNTIWLKHVSRIDHDELMGDRAPLIGGGVGAGSTFSYGGVTFRVASVTSPQLQYRTTAAPSTDVAYVPSEGLDAAYNCDYSNDPFSRGPRGLGNRIAMAAGRPLTLVLPDQTGQVGLKVTSEYRDTNEVYTVLQSSAPETGSTPDMALEVISGGILRLRDRNTGSAGLRLSSASDTALVGGLGTNIIGAFNTLNTGLGAETARVDELTSLNGVAFATGVLAGLGVVAGVGLLATVTSGFVVKNGTRLAVAGASVALTDAASQFIVFNITAATLAATTSAPTSDQIPIAFLTTAGGSVTGGSIRDTRLFVGPLNHRVDLHVGGAGAHFQTLYGAIEFINGWAADGGASDTGRRWRVLVCGPTTETFTTTFRCNGVVVEGSPGEDCAISWGVNAELFDLNGCSDIVFRGLYVRFTGASSLTTGYSRVVWKDATGGTGLTIQGVRVESQTAGRLHGYADLTSATALTIRDSQFVGSSEFGIRLDDASQALIDNVVLGRDAANQYGASAHDDYAGIHLSDCSSVSITNCSVHDWRRVGIRVTGSATSRIRIRDTVISDILFAGLTGTARGVSIEDGDHVVLDGLSIDGVGDVLGTVAFGVRLESSAKHVHVRACEVKDVITNVATGVINGYYTDADRCILTANTYTVSAAGAATEVGFLQAGSRTILDSNQAGGAGYDVAGATLSDLGATNRDDA